MTGNLLNRTLGLLKKNCQSTLTLDSGIAAEGSVFRDTVEQLVKFTHAFFVETVKFCLESHLDVNYRTYHFCFRTF